ncbi:hypothetical protein [Archangium violaceum]|uniref:STAS/SEC14 domain-containing protein n=1 Tax=Archangium violaceum Cb vi76 TaxID=1406225 RepID=A0A084SEH7_9BACT|nr:hypothetical protein [Archangium violaceum]KFA86862.1 hypothetical protein Q664_51720 [Archangium violaceum Cb vi76]
MSGRQVYQDEYFTVLVDDRTGIVRTVRSEKPLDVLEELEGIFARLGAVLDELGRSKYGLLADLRATPGRNDPQFEAAMGRLRPLWVGGFRRVGVLVRSTVGMMQIQRHARHDGVERLISKDEDELLKYLVQDG